MGWYLGHKGLLAPPPPPSVPMLPVFAHFSKFSMYAWGKKGKMLVFTGVYVCVKANLTLVSFFFLVFFAPFPNVLALVHVHSTWYELALFTCFESILLCIDVIHKSASSISKPFCLRVSFTSSHVLRTYSWETLCLSSPGNWQGGEKSNMWLWLKNTLIQHVV